ncbi:MAG TPA: CBS domain-containing protein [Steroidobacteraceae bacterium]
MTTVAQLLASKPRALYSVQPDEPVLEAIRKMAEHSVGALLVMQGAKLEGIVSERDYARKVILKGRSSSDTPVRQIMTAQVLTVTPGQSAQECMALMTNHRCRHLPVIENGAVIGMLSIGDLVRAVLEEQQRAISDLEQYIRG